VTSAIVLVMFLGLLPFLLMPAILAFACRHDARWVILGLNAAVCVGAAVFAAIGVVIGAVPALLVWLGLFVWAIRGTDPKRQPETAPAQD
jgi:hypothetical protein